MLPLESVAFTGGFWAHWQAINRQVTLQHGYQMLEQAGNFDNLRIAAGLKQGQFRGMVFQDSDVYKWLEAVAYELHVHPDPDLRQQADAVIDLVGAAQMPDGYINSYVQVVEPDGRWADLDFGHELYCAGHLFQAAAAYYRATHTTKLLDIAVCFADRIGSTFGPDKRQGTCGHPEVEMALVELYRVTGKSAYVDLAKFFIDQRGKGVMRGLNWMKAEYHQDRVPVRQQDIVEGHAVRAMYLNAGVADLYLETGEKALFDALDRQWEDMVSGKMFITGGLGSRYEGESFGDAYELPADRCYCETCAAIGSVMWNWRMLMITGEGRFADLMERTLYNGVLSGLALDGKHFFYMNPLLSRGGYAREEWYAVACCPPNLMRLLGSLAQYAVTRDGTGLQVHLYNTGTVNAVLPSGTRVILGLETDYPWQGQVRFTIKEADRSTWRLRLRLPEWCPQAAVTINGQPVEKPVIDSGYVVLEHGWMPGDVVDLMLPMEAYLIEAHPRVDAVRDSLAIQRGPILYCLEASSHPDINLLDVYLDERALLQAAWNAALGGFMAIHASGYELKEEWQDRLYRRLSRREAASGRPITLEAIPYYAWANRGANTMRVWVPRSARR
ncbi:MAG TPA: beta-L-arabinofuranosidase domain-containing protein [Aggregatilineales bacterium]|nr:beta-L-arabinofuranosidase domain-containing protein [Aggregatilineales bacterium]